MNRSWIPLHELNQGNVGVRAVGPYQLGPNDAAVDPDLGDIARGWKTVCRVSHDTAIDPFVQVSEGARCDIVRQGECTAVEWR